MKGPQKRILTKPEKILNLRADKEFIPTGSWPNNLRFEDSAKAQEPELRLTFLSRNHSYSDTNSLMGNSSLVCLQSPLAGVK